MQLRLGVGHAAADANKPQFLFVFGSPLQMPPVGSLTLLWGLKRHGERLQERNVPGSTRRQIEREAALKMAAESRAKDAADQQDLQRRGKLSERDREVEAGMIAGVPLGRAEQRERDQVKRQQGVKPARRRIGL